jgi:hypothetical protein
LELTKNYNWEQFGSASPEEVAEAMLSMYLDYVSEPCGGGGCRRIYRIGQGGQIEMSDDAGETWQSAAAEIPPTPARNEPTEEERLCSAAANVVNVLHQTYEEMIDAWQLDSSVDFGIGAFATILGLLVGSWLGVVTAAAIPFVWELFGGVYSTIGTFLQDAWDSDFTNDLTCLFLEAATDTGGVVTFDWGAISQSLADRVAETAAPEDALLWLQLNYMVLFIGVEGLNAAGATTGVVGDCDHCTCEYYFDFADGLQGAILFTTGAEGVTASYVAPHVVVARAGGAGNGSGGFIYDFGTVIHMKQVTVQLEVTSAANIGVSVSNDMTTWSTTTTPTVFPGGLRTVMADINGDWRYIRVSAAFNPGDVQNRKFHNWKLTCE